MRLSLEVPPPAEQPAPPAHVPEGAQAAAEEVAAEREPTPLTPFDELIEMITYPMPHERRLGVPEGYKLPARTKGTLLLYKLTAEWLTRGGKCKLPIHDKQQSGEWTETGSVCNCWIGTQCLAMMYQKIQKRCNKLAYGRGLARAQHGAEFGQCCVNCNRKNYQCPRNSAMREMQRDHSQNCQMLQQVIQDLIWRRDPGRFLTY